MAERSKAPDSRADLALSWVFWSTYVGVGSNPTSDTLFLTFFSPSLSNPCTAFQVRTRWGHPWNGIETY